MCMDTMLELIILLLCTLNVLAEHELLMYVTGEVTRGNYSYYSLTYEGPITLHLYSVSGDSDLYVSQLTSTPTFEPDTYCLHSATCGLDVVDIPKSFHRPVGIGVYGHPSHETSTYLLEAHFQSDGASSGLDDDDEEEEEETERLWVQSPEKPRHEKRADKEGDESLLGALVWSFIDILLEVLFL